MAQPVDAALIAASASITVGLVAAYANARQGRQLAQFKDELERQGRAERRALDEEEAVQLFRVPLQLAAEDLAHRIDNIRTRAFMDYLDDEQRAEIALLATVYRFARFFATLEMLYERAEFLQLERKRPGDSVGAALSEIGKTFASDDYDRADPDDERSSRFMIWREEQRAMGELARDRERNTVAGFATFAARVRGADGRWFETLIDDLKTGSPAESERLALIESQLAELARRLDPAEPP